MARATVNLFPEHKAKFKAFVENDLINAFQCEILDKGEEQARISLLENKQDIINDFYSYIERLKKENNNIYLNFKYYYDYTDYAIINAFINDTYLKIYNDTFKAYKIKEKAEKDFLKHLLYEELKEEITLHTDNIYILDIIKTNEYKEELLKHLQKEHNININIYNDIYHSVLNKVIREFKEDIKLKQQKMQQENKTKIPLGWKVFGIVKVCEKINKKIWK